MGFGVLGYCVLSNTFFNFLYMKSSPIFLIEFGAEHNEILCLGHIPLSATFPTLKNPKKRGSFGYAKTAYILQTILSNPYFLKRN